MVTQPLDVPPITVDPLTILREAGVTTPRPILNQPTKASILNSNLMTTPRGIPKVDQNANKNDNKNKDDNLGDMLGGFFSNLDTNEDPVDYSGKSNIFTSARPTIDHFIM